MLGDWAARIAEGFAFTDILLWIAGSIVAALVMRRWSQLTAAALIAYCVDLIMPFFARALTGMPLDFAAGLAFDRIDSGGAAAVLRLFMYFGLIALLYHLRRSAQR